MPKHKKKHVRRFHRGQPVKPKAPKRTQRGRPPTYAADEGKVTQIRSTDGERSLWESAARYETEMLGLPPGSELTIGPWARRALNERAAVIAAKANGVIVEGKSVLEPTIVKTE